MTIHPFPSYTFDIHVQNYEMPIVRHYITSHVRVRMRMYFYAILARLSSTQ